MVDPLSRESSDILAGEDANVDDLSRLVVTVAVILAAGSLAASVLNLSSLPTKEALAISVVIAKVLLPVVLLVLAFGVERALPVPGLVEVDGVDGEVAHVVQAGALRVHFRNIEGTGETLTLHSLYFSGRIEN